MSDHIEWKYSLALGIYVYQPDQMYPPLAFCLGERMVHWGAGVDVTNVSLRGSVPDNWHGHEFRQDLHTALVWVRESKLGGCEYWEKASI